MEVEVYCPNCGTKQKMQVARDKGFKECINEKCQEILQYSIWNNGRHQCCGYIVRVPN